MADELGVEVVVTDDSTNYSLAIDEAGLTRQQCLVHMKRTLVVPRADSEEAYVSAMVDCWTR